MRETERSDTAPVLVAADWDGTVRRTPDLGTGHRASALIDTAVRASGVVKRFGRGVLDDAQRSVERTLASIDAPWRTEREELEWFAIDPEGAGDRDDAVACHASGSGWMLSIAVADLGLFEGRWLDHAVLARGQTHYLPDRRIAMFPPGTVEPHVSLDEGAMRCALVTDLEVQHNGNTHTVGTPMRPERVRVNRALTYDQATVMAMAHPGIFALAQCATALRERRQRNDTIVFEHDSEPQAERNADGTPTLSEARGRRLSEIWIEEAMLAANEACAQWLAHNKAPGAVWRGHGPIELTQRYAAQRLAGAMGLRVPQMLRGESISQWLDAQHQDKREAAELVARKLLPKAFYAREPWPHAGLGVKCYAHTTSPIRRAADWLCQRAAHIVHGTAHAPALELGPETGERLTALESAQVALERTTTRGWCALALADGPRPPEPLVCRVTGIADFGVFAQSVKYPGVEGMCHVSELGPGWWERTSEATMASDATSDVFVLGEHREMRIGSTDPEQGWINIRFEPKRTGSGQGRAAR